MDCYSVIWYCHFLIILMKLIYKNIDLNISKEYSINIWPNNCSTKCKDDTIYCLVFYSILNRKLHHLSFTQSLIYSNENFVPATREIEEWNLIEFSISIILLLNVLVEILRVNMKRLETSQHYKRKNNYMN